MKYNKKKFQIQNFAQSQFLGFRDMQKHFLNFEKKNTLIWIKILLN
jgi:hypothetical protein